MMMYHRRIGLMGGSFNPAHEGHRHIALEAIKRLKLDEVWWLVAPQNPLKTGEATAPLEERMAKAVEVANHPKIRVTDIEAEWGTRYTADTLATWKELFPGSRCVWIMGADNLEQFHRWERWREIFDLMPVAVFDRPGYGQRCLRSRAALYAAKFRLPERKAAKLPELKGKGWVFLHIRRHPLSASGLRKKLGKKAFLRHNGKCS